MIAVLYLLFVSSIACVYSSIITPSVLSEDETQGWFIPLYDIEQMPYLYSWAVTINNETTADEIAKSYGLINKGQVTL